MIEFSIIEKPASIFDRDREWALLSRFLASPSARLGLVYGRRRLGKTHIVERIAAQVNGLYFCAAQQPSARNLDDFGQAVGRWRNIVSPNYRSWDEALRDVLAHPETGRSVVVLDEAGYLVEQEPAFPSLLQRALDRQPRPVRPVLLSGSSHAVMKTLTAPGKPLRGRASLELVLDPFDFRTTASFWGIQEARLAVQHWSTIGGTPGYRELCDEAAPTSLRDFPAWLTRYVLAPGAPLHREGRVVLLEESTVGETPGHWSVLAAITSGARSRSEIATATGRPSTALAIPLAILTASGLVVRDQDPLHRKRSTYSVCEPIVTTWKEVIEPIDRRKIRRDDRRWFDDIEAPLHSRVIGPAFERLARDWTLNDAAERTLGGHVTAVGESTVGRSISGHGAMQLDVVAIDRDPAGHPQVIAIGEAKHQLRPMGAAQLDRLDAARERLGAQTAKLLLFCDAGFDRTLERQAQRRTDVELIDADRLLTGS